MTFAPEIFSTARLVLRRVAPADEEAIFRYASDPELTRYMSWPTHQSYADTRAFVEMSEREWKSKGIGPYIMLQDDDVIGCTGLHEVAPGQGVTGYILMRDAWGKGYATEACKAMVDLGIGLGFQRIAAVCHSAHAPSARVLEKAGMSFEGILARHTLFPNLSPEPQDVRSYAWVRPA